MIYRMDYDRLYLALKDQLKRQFGIEIGDEWERGVLVYGKRDAALPRSEAEDGPMTDVLIKGLAKLEISGANGQITIVIEDSAGDQGTFVIDAKSAQSLAASLIQACSEAEARVS